MIAFNFKSLFKAAILTAATTFTTASAVADDGLFSTIDIDSVFSEATESDDEDTDKIAVKSTAESIRSVDHLGRLLRIEGFGFEKVGERTYGATTKIDDWTFPTLVTLSPDKNSIGLVLGLVAVDDESKLKSEQMLKLLKANQAVAPYQFSFNSSRSRTELAIVIPNENISSTELSRQLKKLKETGRDSATVWFEDDSTEKTTESTQTTAKPTPNTTTPAVTPSKLVGRWTFAKSTAEVFAIELTAAGQFNLVHVKDGKTNISKGDFSMRGTDLVLKVPNGITLTGPAAMISADKFTFTPSPGNTLTFTKIAS